MIVRPGDPPVLITQPDHAALAARIMSRWTANGLAVNPRRASIMTAIAEHDGGWAEVDGEPMIGPEGQVLDFMTVPLDVRHGVWPRGVGRLEHEPYAAALVAHHAVHVYRRYRGDGAWSAFFAQMEGLRDRHLARSGAAMDTLLADYLFLRLGDLISLVFCNAWQDEQKDDTGAGYTVRLAGSTVMVSPDPFGGADVPITIEGRTQSGARRTMSGVIRGG